MEIVGLRETGLYLFADYYINMKIAEGYTVKKRELNDGWQLAFGGLNLLSLGYTIYHEGIQLTARKTLWVIDIQRSLQIA